MGHLWSTAAAIYPSVGEAEVVVFGGRPKNLLTMLDLHALKLKGTTVLHFGKWCRTRGTAISRLLFTSYYSASLNLTAGVSPLFQLCLERVANHPSVYAPLIHCLPLHMRQKIEQLHKRLTNLSHFRTARLWSMGCCVCVSQVTVHTATNLWHFYSFVLSWKWFLSY